jgi:uncharacterized SAM-dependent methyltransferase
MHLVSDTAQDVAIDALGMTVHFEPGESIHTESSYKYDPKQVEALADETGFLVSQTWTDQAKTFTSNLLVAR